ncbi:nitrile hydratase accessory protein [Mycobacterium sp. CVI_P3]|uniref:Nitrile hydratase accessory protein n=1 Tax=Mycobacterium pinniadriaticum TaxID=2994102 RepID=A0ABT3SIF0_9MYCO|nr:nitrile hydratase accessory protein [Mycobacterium pinniadriaticum]MCX2932793.1 nitrile hydratase accessory protein [Mycobacterium pinniadriaticum]MCX2939147.1 nitrile hydratase accessory protein [Mycobacterium pinniadriaticum]
MTAALDLTGFDDPGGAGALPRSNGELVFDAPWQGRLFGLVVHLCKSGAFEWDEFKAHLIAAIAESGVDETCDPGVYYRQFGEAFCRLAAEKQFFDVHMLESRTLSEGQRLSHADHDHDHDHDHD